MGPDKTAADPRAPVLNFGKPDPSRISPFATDRESDPIGTLAALPDRLVRAGFGDHAESELTTFRLASPRTDEDWEKWQDGYRYGLLIGAGDGLKELLKGILELVLAAMEWTLARGERIRRNLIIDLATGSLWDGRTRADAAEDIRELGAAVEATWAVLQFLKALLEWADENPGRACELLMDMYVGVVKALGPEAKEVRDAYIALAGEWEEQGEFVGHFYGVILFEVVITLLPPLRPVRFLRTVRGRP